MAAVPHAESSIESADSATQVASEDEKVEAAAAQAQAAGESAKNARNQRFVEYVVPRRATAQYVDEKGKLRKMATRPSGAHAHATRADDGSYASRVGVASARAIMRPQDWAANGVAGTQHLVWEMGNNWRIPADQLSAEQIDLLVNKDRLINGVRFELVDGNGRKVDN